MRLHLHSRDLLLERAQGGGEDRGRGHGGGNGVIDIAHPGAVDLGPFLLGERVGFGGGAVVLPRAAEVFGVGEAGGVPVGAEAVAGGGGDGDGQGVGGGGDGEVGVAEEVAPVVLGFDGVERVWGNLGGGEEGALLLLGDSQACPLGAGALPAAEGGDARSGGERR